MRVSLLNLALICVLSATQACSLQEAEAKAVGAFVEATGVSHEDAYGALDRWQIVVLAHEERASVDVYFTPRRMEVSDGAWCQDQTYAMGIFLILRRELIPSDCLFGDTPPGYPGEFCPWKPLGLWEAIERAGPVDC